jgi:hypothetical protein
MSHPGVMLSNNPVMVVPPKIKTQGTMAAWTTVGVSNACQRPACLTTPSWSGPGARVRTSNPVVEASCSRSSSICYRDPGRVNDCEDGEWPVRGTVSRESAAVTTPMLSARTRRAGRRASWRASCGRHRRSRGVILMTWATRVARRSWVSKRGRRGGGRKPTVRSQVLSPVHSRCGSMWSRVDGVGSLGLCCSRHLFIRHSDQSLDAKRARKSPPWRTTSG